MVLKVYVSGMSGNKEVKKRQQRVLMILDSKNIKYDLIDITEPGKESEKELMQTKSTSNGATVSDPDPRHPLPPQIFNEVEYCGDYDAFDLANELDTLEQFLKLAPADTTVVSSAQIKLKQENGGDAQSTVTVHENVEDECKAGKVDGAGDANGVAAEGDGEKAAEKGDDDDSEEIKDDGTVSEEAKQKEKADDEEKTEADKVETASGQAKNEAEDGDEGKREIKGADAESEELKTEEGDGEKDNANDADAENASKAPKNGLDDNKESKSSETNSPEDGKKDVDKVDNAVAALESENTIGEVTGETTEDTKHVVSQDTADDQNKAEVTQDKKNEEASAKEEQDKVQTTDDDGDDPQQTMENANDGTVKPVVQSDQVEETKEKQPSEAVSAKAAPKQYEEEDTGKETTELESSNKASDTDDDESVDADNSRDAETPSVE